MHDDKQKTGDDPVEDLRDEVEAADDTGMIRQQQEIVEAELGLPPDAGT
jgi:hypothetical protein